jgi:hypothetical protein
MVYSTAKRVASFLSLFCLFFAVVEVASPSSQPTPLDPKLESLGSIEIRFFQTTTRQVLRAPSPPPPLFSSTMTNKRSLSDATSPGNSGTDTAEEPDVGCFHKVKVAGVGEDKKKFFKMSTATEIGPMLSPPVLSHSMCVTSMGYFYVAV